MAFSWTQVIPGVGYEYSSVATVALVGSGLCAAAFFAHRALGSGDERVPLAKKLSLRALLELATDYVAGLAETIIGPAGRVFVPMFTTIFVFILINNWVGLIPGMTPATEDINLTFAMGLFSFVVYNSLGVREHGISYFKQFLGPVIWLAPLMLVVELISHFVRPFSLGLRMATVLKGDHMVLGTFLDMVPILAPVPFYLLGILVGFLQALVFTLLSMVYVSMAISHDH